jgi:hypothetical protein
MVLDDLTNFFTCKLCFLHHLLKVIPVLPISKNGEALREVSLDTLSSTAYTIKEERKRRKEGANAIARYQSRGRTLPD